MLVGWIDKMFGVGEGVKKAWTNAKDCSNNNKQSRMSELPYKDCGCN